MPDLYEDFVRLFGTGRSSSNEAKAAMMGRTGSLFALQVLAAGAVVTRALRRCGS